MTRTCPNYFVCLDIMSPNFGGSQIGYQKKDATKRKEIPCEENYLLINKTR